MVSEVIQKNPNLKIYIENAGFPYVDKTVSLMYTYPTAFGDLSTLTWIVPRNVFHKYLQELMEAGLGKRLMFGSDQMLWPQRIEDGIAAINEAYFLSEQQKRDIFYNKESGKRNRPSVRRYCARIPRKWGFRVGRLGIRAIKV